ncbi:serine hydrolase FSH [Podospora fimiseda]|uniref:Serine hydrolase FSH n=1 Tax=Podospora fimiseda TaxID=252190 RepID=A0AAN7GPW0_9PEZI|nr:serine hydrolase FSH [Podospora fimiseda]
MRIICLHGVGSSGRILDSQMQPLVQALDPSYEFVFVDGPFLCERGPGMAAFLDGPFFSHTEGYSPDQMAEAHDYLETTIDELGPFDGVFGFSQGGALAISYMHRKQVRDKIRPFKFALIMSSVIPCSADPGDCLCAIRRQDRNFTELLEKTVVEARKNKALLPDIDLRVYDRDCIDEREAPRLMHGLLLKEKIRTPTVHVTGRKDFVFMRAMSDAAREVCEVKMLKSLEHGGGHQPPQRAGEVKAVARAVEWAVAMGQRVGGVHI